MEGSRAALAGCNLFRVEERRKILFQPGDKSAACGNPAEIERLVYIFFLIPFKIGDGERNKLVHECSAFLFLNCLRQKYRAISTQAQARDERSTTAVCGSGPRS